MYRGWNYSSRPFKWTENECSRWKSHLCRVGWKFGYKKVTFVKMPLESYAYVFKSKNTIKWLWAKYSRGTGIETHPASCKGTIYNSGPLPRPRGAKDEIVWAQTMSTGNMSLLPEQHSKYHFGILQTYIPANKEKVDVGLVSKEMYFKNKQSGTKKE